MDCLLLLNSGESNISSEGTNAQMVGRRLAELGDQIDAMYGEEIEDIMSLYENPQEAFKSFSHVVQNVFEWDENGLRKCYACMYVYMYVCTYVCICMYVCMYVYMYICMYVRMYVCMYVHMYVCMSKLLSESTVVLSM